MYRLRRLLVPCMGIFAIQLAATSAFAAISPANVKKMQDEATDVLRVTITNATITKTEVNLGYWRKEVAYEATVTGVARSASGTEQDDAITIRSYHQGGLLPPGPKNPPMLNEGWQGTVYLNKIEGDKQFRIAVHGHSFEAKEGNE